MFQIVVKFMENLGNGILKSIRKKKKVSKINGNFSLKKNLK